MNLQDIHRNARILRRRYLRGIINLAEFTAELWQLASEQAFYTIPDAEWFDIMDSWKGPEDEFKFWQAIVKELAELPEN
jgi:hypothetical protein